MNFTHSIQKPKLQSLGVGSVNNTTTADQAQIDSLQTKVDEQSQKIEDLESLIKRQFTMMSNQISNMQVALLSERNMQEQ